jgi:glycosyltransferase involved in cell wall biosynthesis
VIAIPARLTVAQLIPALDSGGAERCVVDVAQAVVRAGHRSLVISAGGRLMEELVAGGSEHIARRIGRKSPLVLREAMWLRSFVQAEKIDLIDIHSRVPAWAAWLAFGTGRQKPRPALVTTVHGFNRPGFYSRIMTRGDVVIAVSDAVRTFLQTHYGEGTQACVTVIPRGVNRGAFAWQMQVDSEWRERFFQEFPECRNRHLLTLPGRLTRGKGHGDLLRLVSRLQQRGHSVQGLCVGSGDGHSGYVRELQSMAGNLGIADRVSFTGVRNDLPEIYAASSLVLSLSTKPESFGLVVAEALSMGRPVVGYAHGGVAEQLRISYPQGAVQPGNLQQLEDTVTAILSGHTSPPTAPQTIGTVEMTEKTVAVYEQLVRQRCL